jgi:hypothetical protein
MNEQEFLQAVMSRLERIYVIKDEDRPFVVDGIKRCFHWDFSAEDAFHFIRRTEHVNPTLSERAANAQMRCIGLGYPKYVATCERIQEENARGKTMLASPVDTEPTGCNTHELHIYGKGVILCDGYGDAIDVAMSKLGVDFKSWPMPQGHFELWRENTVLGYITRNKRGEYDSRG